ncbi:hypothetical protein V5N11_004376 [Cardamine amara subsp. amara]|uniref:DUF4218 domain-containing protein n=1 Tax=Cardamine amara subsp. amara TaxID=228776 RepID=A0ABD1B7A9_CARAN
MKNHDCHVVMQRLIPFAFANLLHKDVHPVIAAVSAFFQDLCTRTLTVDGIRHLQENIPLILCNLEKILPPSFFDVMEHLPIHLPREATLGGPVQYRWMYLFERYMFHLKKKVKNLSKVEGSIVAQSLNEEASHFAEYYFPSEVRTKSRRPARHDDRGERAIYSVYVPELFSQVGRVSGKGKRRKLSHHEFTHLHMYILTNCEDIVEYERIYMGLIRGFYPTKSEEELHVHKEKDFMPWLQFYVSEGITSGQSFPTWVVEMVNGPKYIATSYPKYCTRGYAFRVYEEGRTRTTSDYGISTQTGDLVYYDILREILEVHYAGMLDLRCTVFMCDWYDPIIGRGVLIDQFGVASVHSTRRLLKYDPFILASQADHVCYIWYPRVTRLTDPWITVTAINPKGRIYGVPEHDALQAINGVPMDTVKHSCEVELVVDFTQFGDDIVHSDSEEEHGEFSEDSDDIPSEGSSTDAE